MTSFVFLPFAIADNGFPGWIIQALLVFFFIGLPILRSIREAAGKRRELERRRAETTAETTAEPRGVPSAEAYTDSAPDPVEQMEEARRRFEALLRGEEPRSASPTVSIPVREARPELVPQARLGGRLSELRPAPNENDAERGDDPDTADPEHFIEDEELRSREEIDRRLRVERDARSDFLRRERENGIGRRSGVASDPMTSLGAPTAAATIHRTVRPDALFGPDASAADRQAAMRRAFVASEILGAPTALRDAGSGPASLRSSR